MNKKKNLLIIFQEVNLFMVQATVDRVNYMFDQFMDMQW